MALTQDIKTVRLKPDGSDFAVAAGSSACTSDILDTAGYTGVRFVIGFGAVVTGAATSIKVQQDTDPAGGTMADVLGSSQTVADTADNGLFITEIVTPLERYMRVITSRATQNATIDFLIAELFGSRKRPVTKDATVVGQEVAVSPIEGTA